MGKTLPITFNKGNCGRLKNHEKFCGKFVGKPGREILFFLVFLVVWAAPRVFVLSPTPPQRSLYILTAPDRLPRPSPAMAVHSACSYCKRTNKHIYIYRYFIFYAAVSG